MPATYEPIASQTLTGNSASVEFTSIPGTYTDLIIVVFGRNNTGTGYRTELQVNSDTGSNYSWTRLLGDGSSATSSRGSSQTWVYGGWTGNSTSTFDVNVVQIMSYASTNVFKTFLQAGGHTSLVARTVGLWRSTSAITSVKLTPEASAQFVSGSTFSLYGIKAA